MQPQIRLRNQWILVVVTLVISVAAFVVPGSAQQDLAEWPQQDPEDTAYFRSKVNSQFFKAIGKGDVKKMRALAAKGAEVSPPGYVVDDIDVVRTFPGGCSYSIKKGTLMRGPSRTMLRAIQSAQLESVRALLTLGFDAKTAFYVGGAPTISRVSPAFLYQAALLGTATTVRVGEYTFRVGSDTMGSVVVYPCPTAARKATYLGLAQVELAQPGTRKRQQQLQQIVNLLLNVG